MVGSLLMVAWFFHWVMSTLEVLNQFVSQVVITRRDSWLLTWSNWLREDLGSRPYAWLRPDFVPPSPFLAFVEDPDLGTSQYTG